MTRDFIKMVSLDALLLWDKSILILSQHVFHSDQIANTLLVLYVSSHQECSHTNEENERR